MHHEHLHMPLSQAAKADAQVDVWAQMAGDVKYTVILGGKKSTITV